MVRPLAYALVLASLFVAGPSAAMTPPRDRPSQVSLLAPEEATAVRLRSVHTTLDCTGEDQACAFTSTYRLNNDADQPVTLEVVADGYRLAGVELSIDGSPRAGRTIEREGDSREYPAVTHTTRSYELELAARSEATVVVTGTMNARPPEDRGLVKVSLPTRHPVLGDNPGPTVVHYDFALETLSRWSGRPTASFEIVPRQEWDMSTIPESTEVDPAQTPNYRVEARHTPEGLMNGGPYVGFGATMDEPGGVVGRVGYEVGFGMWGILGLALDTDFGQRFVIAPSLHAASAGWTCIFPSFGMGLGPAVRLGDRTALGGRLQAEIQLPFVGVVGNMDWYPALDAPDTVDFAILGRISL
jgi:hypothetical protein